MMETKTMAKSENPFALRIRAWWGLLAIGVLLLAAGLALGYRLPEKEMISRLVSGIGITLIIIGAVQAVLYRFLGMDKENAVRIAAAESDERSVRIRQRAGSRGFWVAMVMIFGALMWVSAASGSDAVLNVDALWSYLVACTVTPLVVYSVSTVYDQVTY